MFKQIFFIALLLIPAGLLFQRNLWIEPDSIAFYNRTCENGNDFQTPIIAKELFLKIPCEQYAWKTIQITIIILIILSLLVGIKAYSLPDKTVWLSGLLYFFPFFLLAIEDDHLAFPIIAIATYLLYRNKKNNLAKILYAITIITLTTTIWSGSFVPMTIILASTIIPITGILAPIIALLAGQLHISFGDSASELATGTGFFGNNLLALILIPFLLIKTNKEFLEKYSSEIASIFGLLILSFIIPKFGMYTIIPLVVIAGKKFLDQKELFDTLCTAGFLSFILITSSLLVTAQPDQKTWVVVQEAVDLQKQGKPLYNDWWVGRWIANIGGEPTSEGGPGSILLAPPESDYYWLGEERLGCETIDSHWKIFLQYCS